MQALLGVLLALVVSGDEEVTVEGVLGGSVLLPCTCLGRDLNKDFKWQKEGKEMVFKHHRAIAYFTDSYKDRAETFLAKNDSNCSVNLTNITQNDEGRYRCSFYVHETYKLTRYTRFFVNLTAVNCSHQNVTIENTSTQNLREEPPGSLYSLRILFKILPIVLMLGLCVALCYHWKVSQKEALTI